MDVLECSLTGNADMYGLGIRLGFYLQWIAGSLSSLLRVKSDVIAVRSALLGFTIATFIAVIAQTANSANTTVDIYVTLLLCFGFFYSFIAKYFWRIYARLTHTPDPTIYTLVVASPEFDVIQRNLFLAVSGFRLWFWARRVLVDDQQPGCAEYGFLFYPLELKNDIMRYVNIALDSCLIFIVIYELVTQCYFFYAGEKAGKSRENRLNLDLSYEHAIPRRGQIDSREAQAYKDSAMPKHALTWVFFCRLFASAVVIAATELTIYWNNLRGVYELGSAGQLIPFVLGSMMLVHTVYRWIRPSKEGNGDAESSGFACMFCQRQLGQERGAPSSRRRGWRRTRRGRSHLGP